MTNCQQMLRKLSEIIEGTAPWPVRATFYMHLAMCPPCRQYVRQFKQLKQVAGEVLPEDLPEDFFEILEKALKQTETNAPPCPPKEPHDPS